MREKRSLASLFYFLPKEPLFALGGGSSFVLPISQLEAGILANVPYL